MLEFLVIRGNALCEGSQLWDVVPNITTGQVLLLEPIVPTRHVCFRKLTLNGKPLNSCRGIVVDNHIDIGMEYKAFVDRILLLELNITRNTRSQPAKAARSGNHGDCRDRLPV